MIYVRDKGRLCNNILQYGHAYAWARENGLKSVSMRFAYKYKGMKICSTPGHNFFRYLRAKYAAKLHIIPEVVIDSPDIPEAELVALYNKVRSHARRGVVLTGWWVRNYDLFLKYRREITDLFSFTRRDGEELLPPTGENSVLLGVHVRRGDYIRWHGGKYFYTDSQYVEIINRFIALMRQQGKRVNVAVFTNDRDIDRDYYSKSLDTEADEIVFPFGTAVSDLQALSRCDYIIGAPSTFSLTASMYNDSPIYFIEDPTKKFTLKDFSDFATLFRYNY